jgi:succinate-acetate transporter protein
MITVKAVEEKKESVLRKMCSRKLIVWIIATVLVFMGVIAGEHWVALSFAYLGINVAQKGVLHIMGNSRETPDVKGGTECF